MNLVQNYSDHFGNSQRSLLSPTGSVKSTSPLQKNGYENGYENCTYTAKLHQQQVHEHLHAQVAQPVSKARRARSSVHFLWCLCHTHLLAQGVLESHFIPSSSRSVSPWPRFLPFLLRPVLHRLLPLLLPDAHWARQHDHHATQPAQLR